MAQGIRVPGSGYTVFTWDSAIIGFAESVQVTAVRPVSPAQVIQPLNALRPIEIAVPAAHTEGELRLTLLEIGGESIGDRLSVITKSNDVTTIMNRMAALQNPISIVKIITHPDNRIGRETYHGCIVVDVDDSEVIDIRAMPATNKTLTVWFTHSQKSWANPQASNSNPFVVQT